MKSVTLMEILQAREDRVRRQEELLTQYQKPLICFTMNIAGPVKTDPQIERGFREGCRALEQQLLRCRLPVLHREQTVAATGCEAFYAVDAPAEQLKALTVELEEGTALGRLYDLDVLTADGKKLERSGEERACLICGKPGRACVRSRAHSVEELQAKTHEILKTALDALDRETVAELAQRALLYEVCVTPKPGLVDRNNAGSHRDMDIYTFLSSAASLYSYFARCAEIGRETAQEPPKTTFRALRWPGKLAENAMLASTGGVNTHKGAIFTMGVICGALGRLDRTDWAKPETVLQTCAAMTAGLTTGDFAGVTEETAVTAGERLYARYGITGIRGQMEEGLPAVLHHGLPALEAWLELGATPDEAGAAALLALIEHTQDTNLIARGGMEGVRWAADVVKKTQDLLELDQWFIQRNLSPGGCADLLAVCWLFHFLKHFDQSRL